MSDILGSGQKIQIPSTVFNFLIVVNDCSYSLDITAMHDDIVTPKIVIRDAAKKATTEEDKAIEEKLRKLEGVEV